MICTPMAMKSAEPKPTLAPTSSESGRPAMLPKPETKATPPTTAVT